MLLAATPPAIALPPAVPAGAAGGWTASWGAALMMPAEKHALSGAERAAITLRQVVRLSLGGPRLRVRFSNVHGEAPLGIGAATLAPGLAGSSHVEAAAVRALHFGGALGITIPPGGEAVSDPLDFAADAGQDVAVSLYATALPARQSVHVAAHSTQFAVHGNQVAAPLLDGARRLASWYHLTGVEVEAPGTPLLVAAGDSITDGSGAGRDANERWTDWLVRRIADEKRPSLAVVNAGIGGNQMLRDDIGPNLLARFERDVLQRPGVTHALVLIGVNDLGRLHKGGRDSPAGRAALIARLQDGWRQMAARARAGGICLAAGTLPPYGASTLHRPAPRNEADRRAFNDWLRGSPLFDAVADFDAAVRDPAAPARLLPAYDSGDGLHLSPAGYRAMALAVPLEALAACRRTRRPAILPPAQPRLSP